MNPGSMMIESNDEGVKVTLYGVGKPESKHDWVDLNGWRKRGKPALFDIETRIKYGDFVVTGPQVGTSDELRYVGYVVQIRKGAGLAGTDKVFVRHPDGTLIVHNNQNFYVLTDEDAAVVREHCRYKPEDDGGDVEYFEVGKDPRAGFVIPKES